MNPYLLNLHLWFLKTIKKQILLVFLLFLGQTVFAQFQVQTTTKESRCSANGQIMLTVSGGTAPYSYQLIGSTRPIQTSNIFDLLPPATYQIRITDNLGANMVVNATILGNYQAPTTQCTVNGYDATMTVSGGRLPFSYSIGLYGSLVFGMPQSSNIFPCLPIGTHNFRVYDSCNNFYTTTSRIDVKPLNFKLNCQQINGKVNISTTDILGGIPPYQFTCINNLDDTFRNTTGNFSQLSGCVFKVILSDKCNQSEKPLTCSSLKGFVKCANFNNHTATVSAEGGIPPYRFQSLDRSGFSTNGIYTNINSNDGTYHFSVTDACGATHPFEVSQMNITRIITSNCPYDGKLQLQLSQNASLSDTCQRCSSFFPYRFDCLDCVPPKTVIDNNVSNQSPISAFVDFTPLPPNTYHFVVTNGCQDTIHVEVNSKPTPPVLSAFYDCKTNTIVAKTNLLGDSGVVYILRDTFNRFIATNRTGVFNSPYPGFFRVLAVVPTCDTAVRSVVTAPKPIICYRLGSKINPNTGICDFKWILDAKASSATTYQLTGGPNNINISNTTGNFENLSPNSTYYLRTDCTMDTITTDSAILPNLTVKNLTTCTSETGLLAEGGRNEHGCLQLYIDKYALFDSIGNFIMSNVSGEFLSLVPNKLYEVRIQNPDGCYIQSVKIKTVKYQRPILSASYGIICATGQTTGNIRAILRGGIPPFTITITNPANIYAPIITNENTALFNNLPPGNYALSAYDACGISSDFATSVGPLQFTPQYSRRCDGSLTLEVPFIDSATYKWTNNAGNIVGNNRILTLNDTSAQTFTINITTPQPCSFTNSINIPRFSPTQTTAQAGPDFVSTSATTNLHAQAIPQGSTGRWQAIAPSSGTTIFSNVNNPNTNISVSNIPGEYTYVWEVKDNASGCINTDTIVVVFCTDALVINANITTTPSSCKTPTGKATISIISPSNSMTYKWSNGKTTPTVDSLSAGIYTVTITSPLVCSPPRIDTVVIKEPNTIPPRTIDTTLCAGNSLKIGTKIYTQTGNYRDTLHSVAGCDSIINANLHINRVPVERLGIIHQLNAQYCGDSIALNRLGDTSSTYAWQWQNVPCVTCHNPSILPLNTAIYYVTITDKSTSCTARDSVNIAIEGNFSERIPNAFSPNGDGINDVFNVLPDPCIKIVTRLRIFNRWGQLIFDENNLSPQNNEGWHGLNGSKPLASDVYVFIMNIQFVDGTTKQVSGEINLIN